MIERLGYLSPAMQRIILIVGCVLLYAVWFSRVPLTEIDEVRYAEATRQMVTTGNYLIPQYNGEPRYQKPIFYYWVQSVSVRVLGVNEFAARLPSALIAIALVLLMHGFLLRWFTAQAPARAGGAAFLGAGALATMPFIAIWARGATTDITLTFLITATLLALLQAELTRARWWYLPAAVAGGLAFLTKGPVGVVLPGAVWLVYHLAQRNLAAEARRVPWLPVILVFLLVAVPWYLAAYLYDGPGFFTRFFLEENLSRFASIKEGHGFGNRLLGLALYLPVAVVMLFPYSAFLIRDLLAPPAGETLLRTDALLPRLRRFAWAWLWAIIAVFAFSKTQLPSYIQSIAPAAAILFALQALGWQDRAVAPARRGRWVEVGVLLLVGLLFIAGPIYVLLIKGTIDGPLGAAVLPQPQATVAAGALALVGLIFFAAVIRRAARDDARCRIPGIAGAWALVLAVLLLGVAPLVIATNYRLPVTVGAYLRTLPAEMPVLYYRALDSEDLIYYSQRTIEWYTGKEDRLHDLELRLRALEGRAIVVTDSRGLASLPDTGHFTVLKQFGDVLVVQSDPRALTSLR